MWSDPTAFDDLLVDLFDLCNSACSAQQQQVTNLQNRLAAIESQQQKESANSSTAKQDGELKPNLFTRVSNRSHEELRKNELRLQELESEMNVTTKRVSRLASLINATASATEQQLQSLTENFGHYVEQSELDTTIATVTQELNQSLQHLSSKISKNSVSLVALKPNLLF